MPGLVKVGLATSGVENRVRSLATAGVPAEFEVIATYMFPQEIDYKDLVQLEREAHRRLAPFRYSGNREFFKTTPEQASVVLRQLQVEAEDNLARGLTPTGGARQVRLVTVEPEQAGVRRSPLVPLKPPEHWHVLRERDREGNQATVFELLPRTYWTKGGSNGRVKRDKAEGTYSICVPCKDTACPDFGKTRPGKTE